MKEVDFQTRIKAAVIDMGGFSFKMANRFLVGVSDLLVQLPTFSTSLWEVKIRPFPRQSYSGGVEAPLTPLQKKFMRQYLAAGGFGGVIMVQYSYAEAKFAIYPAVQFKWDPVTSPWIIPHLSFFSVARGDKMKPFKDRILRVHQEFKDGKYPVPEWTEPLGKNIVATRERLRELQEPLADGAEPQVCNEKLRELAKVVERAERVSRNDSYQDWKSPNRKPRPRR